MTRRALAWLATLPLAAAGVLAAHVAAYTATGAPLGPTHAYLEHAPQVVGLAATLGLLGLAVQSRGGGVSRVPFAVLGALAFAAQEHLERLAHDGEVPLLLADRTFLLGLLLQIPVGIACAAVASRVLGSAAGVSVGVPPALPQWTTPVVVPVRAAPRAAAVRVRAARAPPYGLRP